MKLVSASRRICGSRHICSCLRVGGLGSLLVLASCGGGGSGDGVAEEQASEPATAEAQNLLPSQFFMPQGYSQVELLIEHGSYLLRLICQSASSATDCQGHTLAGNQCDLLIKNGGETKQFKLGGNWYQMSLNTFNRICDFWVEAETLGVPYTSVQLARVDMEIHRSEMPQGGSTQSLILYGTIAAGSFLFAGEEQPALTGASVRLTYTR